MGALLDAAGNEEEVDEGAGRSVETQEARCAPATSLDRLTKGRGTSAPRHRTERSSGDVRRADHQRHRARPAAQDVDTIVPDNGRSINVGTGAPLLYERTFAWLAEREIPRRYADTRRAQMDTAPT